MSQYQLPTSAVTRYQSVLRNYRTSRLPADVTMPQPPSAWPTENVALFEKFLAWLIADGAGVTCICAYYLPMAGHLLGLHLQPHPEMDVAMAIENTMAFVCASQPSERWILLCGNALNRFRRFMDEERGVLPLPNFAEPVDVSCYHEGLPSWLVEVLTQYCQLRQANWRPARRAQTTLRFWNSHSAVFRWLFATYEISAVTEIKRKHLYAFMDARLAEKASPSTVNMELRSFQALLRFLQEQEMAVPLALLRLPGLKQADRLPRFLTDAQVGKLRDAFEQAVEEADSAVSYRNACLNRATFYLMWQGGLRLGEVEELTLDNLNLSAQQLTVRQGKGLKDRMVYLTDVAVTALQTYLNVRGDSALDHLFLYRHQPLNKDFVRGRLQAVGKAVGVAVTPHQLRHTYATQLLNAGCDITTIQALLGHQRLNTTMVYARVHNETVAEDYFTAMEKVEKRLTLQLNPPPEPQATTVTPNTKSDEMLTLLDALQAKPLSGEQQALLTVLRHNIEAMTQSQETYPAEQLVTTPTAPLNTQVAGLPPP